MKIYETGNDIVDILNYQKGRLKSLTPDTELKRLVIQHKEVTDKFNEVQKRLYDKKQIKEAIDKEVIEQLNEALNI